MNKLYSRSQLATFKLKHSLTCYVLFKIQIAINFVNSLDFFWIGKNRSKMTKLFNLIGWINPISFSDNDFLFKKSSQRFFKVTNHFILAWLLNNNLVDKIIINNEVHVYFMDVEPDEAMEYITRNANGQHVYIPIYDGYYLGDITHLLYSLGLPLLKLLGVSLRDYKMVTIDDMGDYSCQ